MRTPLIVVLLILSSGVGMAGTPPPDPPTRVRALTASAASLIADATRRSATVRGLVETLENSDVIVYVSDDVFREAHGARAGLTFVSLGGGIRYLLIRMDSWLSPPWVRMSDLGHELQHAVEVARAPEVRDAASLGRLYRRIGWESERGHFESEEARAVGIRVLNQVAWLRR